MEAGFDVVVLEPPADPKRNPPWDRDELILPLDLYLREGLAATTHPAVLRLSELLNQLPLASTFAHSHTLAEQGCCDKL